jgi:hypothetical protein
MDFRMSTNATRRKRTKLRKAKWAVYTAAGTAAVTAIPTEADADITYSGPVNIVVNAPAGSVAYGSFSIGGAYFVGAHVRLSSPNSNVGRAFFGGGNTAGTAGVAGTYVGAFPYVDNLAYGSYVSAQVFGIPQSYFGTLAYQYGYGNDEFLSPGIGYIAFRFDNGAGTQYGWARVDMEGAPGNGYTIVDYAYADPGESIFAGQTAAIPEPASLGALALGAVGLMSMRRKRAAALAA